jgi:Bacterial low temperature requirement A protein (LtrA)
VRLAVCEESAYLHMYDERLLALFAARQRQRWDDQQILPHVNWGDLFFDLFYVAAAYNLAVILKESPSWEGFVYFISCYVVIVAQWNEKVIYDARFAPEDNIFHRSMEILHLLVLGTAIQHIRPVEVMHHTVANSTTFVFSLSLVVMNVIHIKRSEDIQRNVVGGEEAKHHAAHDVTRKVCSLVPFVLAACVSGYDYFIRGMDEQNAELANDMPILLCLGGFACEQLFTLMDVYVFIPNGARHFKEIRVPVNIDFTL